MESKFKKYVLLSLALILILISGCSRGVSLSVSELVCDPIDGEDCATVDNGTLQVNDYLVDLSLERLNTGDDALVFSGHNPDVDNTGSIEDVWEGGGLLQYQTSSETQVIVSTSINDTLLGTGLRVLFVSGLNGTFDVVTEIVVMNGTTPVTTVNEFIRMRFMAGILGGSHEANVGIITATSSVTGLLQTEMDADESFTKNSQFTAPRGRNLIFKRVQCSATKSGGQTPLVEIKGKIRFANSSIWIETFDQIIDTAVTSSLIIDFPVGNVVTEKSDIRLEVSTTADNTDVSCRIWLITAEGVVVLTPESVSRGG